MTVFIIFIAITLGISALFSLIKYDTSFLRKMIKNIFIISTIVFSITLLLYFLKLEIKGKYTTQIIGWCFIASTFLFLSLNKINLFKVITILIIIPVLILLSILLMSQKIDVYYKAKNDTNIIIREGYNCENLEITKSTFGILNKKVYIDNGLCLSGANKIKEIKTDDKSMVFLIYHDGKLSLENPYYCEIKNMW